MCEQNSAPILHAVQLLHDEVFGERTGERKGAGAVSVRFTVRPGNIHFARRHDVRTTLREAREYADELPELRYDIYYLMTSEDALCRTMNRLSRIDRRKKRDDWEGV